MVKKLNGSVKWVIVALALLTVVFNSGILYRDVQHLREEVSEIKGDVKDLRNCLMGNGLVLNEKVQARID